MIQILDTGPLVAFLNGRDRHHEWAQKELGRHPPPLFTCEAVLSEACFLLARDARGPDAVLALVERDLLRPSFRIEGETSRVRRLMKRYADQPMSFADACLVRMTELNSDPILVTLDSDFRVYRRHGRQVIPLATPLP